MTESLKDLINIYARGAQCECVPLPASGSNRRYYRLTLPSDKAIAAEGTSHEENAAFISLSSHFLSKGLPVPRVLAESEDGMSYIQEDLGDKTLFDTLASSREAGVYSEEDKSLLLNVISELPRFQYEGAQGLDFSVCYPQSEFDRRTVMFDLNYFKYCFLKATGVEFNEIRLQDDFERLCEDLVFPCKTFMYRDFQSRNVMLKDGKPYFIDFQGGRRGPIYYDLASFVYQARAAYPSALREELIQTYLKALAPYEPALDEGRFRSQLRLFVLFRTLQVLGAYGFRGFFERKPHFIKSVPPAIENLKTLIAEPFDSYPYLCEVLRKMVNSPFLAGEGALSQRGAPCQANDALPERAPLTVTIYSFSFKKGLPQDSSGNGGGYIFDCRGTNNPGRYEQYKQLTGMDKEVIDFLEKDGEILDFLKNVYRIVDFHVNRFVQRGFTHLQVAFGCTGGRHRSVYCAEALSRRLASRGDVRVHLIHRERGIDRIIEPLGPTAMIFAAGLGTRLKPLTDSRPKALVEVGGKPLVAHVMEKLQGQGVGECVVNVHHFAPMLRSYLQGQDFGLKVSISDESERLLDTGGGVLKAEPLLKGERFILHNVDILSNLDIRDLMVSARVDALSTLVVSERKTSRYLLFDADMRLVGWTNVSTGEVRSPYKDLDVKGCRALAFAGIHYVSRRIFGAMRELGFSGAFPIMDFYLAACERFPIYGYVPDGFRMVDVGKPEALTEAYRSI